MTIEDISVIVPVYNVAPFLRRCVESLLHQEYDQFQLILVDDGSTDGSGAICDEYGRIHPEKVYVIHQENRGPGAARNAGIKVAKGSWIVFADADDVAGRQYLSDLYQLACAYEADIAQTGYVTISKRNNTCSSTDNAAAVLSPEEAICRMWYQKGISNFPWGKIFRRRLFDAVRFPENVLYEDLAILYLLFAQANKIAVSAKADYYYFIRSDSIMTSAWNPRKMDRVRVSRQLLDWANTQTPAIRAAAKERFFLSNVQVLREVPFSRQYAGEISELWNNICRYRGSVIGNKEVKMTNRIIALASCLGLHPLKWMGDQYTKIYK